MKRSTPALLLVIALLLLAVVALQLQRPQAAAAGQALARAQQDYLRPAQLGNPIVLRGCVIRFDQLSSTGKSVRPRILANSSHICVGVTSIRVDWDHGGDLILENADTDEPVIVAFAEEDETLVSRDISCGPSGGHQSTRIACYRDGTHIPAHSLQMYHRYANLWVGIQNWDGA